MWDRLWWLLIRVGSALVSLGSWGLGPMWTPAERERGRQDLVDFARWLREHPEDGAE